MGSMIDKIAWLHLENGAVLCSRSKGKDAFYLPGGKREGTESDLETLVREVREELSVEIDPESAKLFGIFRAEAHGKAAGVIVRMSCYTADYHGELHPDNEIEELAWFTTADMERISAVDKLIFTALHDKGLLN